MAGGGTPSVRTYPSSFPDEERARRVDALAADARTCFRVLRTARRFPPLVGTTGVVLSSPSIAADGTSEVVVDDDDAGRGGGGPAATAREEAEAWEWESNMRLAGAGITPPGNDDDRSMGASLTAGHISDPFP